MPRNWTERGPGEELWRFGKEGGFRELRESPGLEWLLNLKSVKASAREQGIEEAEAARHVLDKELDALDISRARALRKWFQIEIGGYGPDLGARRAAAGAEMKTKSRPEGISGRTWERRYEQPAVRLLAQRLEALDRREFSISPVLLAVPPPRVDGEPLNRFLAAGFVQEVVGRLSRLKNLAVLPPTSFESWDDKADQISAVRDGTDADAVLTSELRDESGVLQLDARLFTLPKGTELWSRRFRLSGDTTISADVNIADQVASALGLSLSRMERERLTQQGTDDARAYELYLRAKGLAVENNADDNRVALGLVDQAIDFDNGFADAYALRGYLLWRDYFSGWGAIRDTLDLSLNCVDRAIHLNPRCIDARYTRIRVCWDLGRLEDALAEGRHAVEDSPHATESLICMARALNNGGMADLSLRLVRDILAREPDNVTARKLLIWNLLMTGEYQEAATAGVAYHKLHPADANTGWAVAGALLANKNYEDAIGVCRQVLAHDHTDATNWLLLGFAHQYAGDAALAERAWRDGASLVSARVEEAPTNLRIRAWLGNLQGCLGEASAVRTQADYINDRESRNGYLAYRVASAFAALGSKDAALRELRVAMDNGFFSVQLVRFEEHLSLDKLRGGALYETRVAELEGKVENVRSRYRDLIVGQGAA